MECWKYSVTGGLLNKPAYHHHKAFDVELYNGKTPVKVAAQKGSLFIIQPLRIEWVTDRMNYFLDLSYVASVRKEVGSRGLFSKSKRSKLIFTCYEGCNQSPPIFPSNPDHEFTMEFPHGDMEQFYTYLEAYLKMKQWEKRPELIAQTKRLERRGIVGIERNLEKDALKNKLQISEAFQDINKLIDSAKPMVQLMHKISNSIKDKQGGLTDDETVQFRQHLLSLGVRDPVTKGKYGTGSEYFSKLAIEISNILTRQVQLCGGMMSLVEAFCRVNRARGLELVSPEDLMDACQNLEPQNQKIHLVQLGDNVKVLRHVEFDEVHYVSMVISLFDQFSWISPEDYASICGTSYLIAKHALVLCEEQHRACRDESIEGLRFYPSERFWADETYDSNSEDSD